MPAKKPRRKSAKRVPVLPSTRSVVKRKAAQRIVSKKKRASMHARTKAPKPPAKRAVKVAPVRPRTKPVVRPRRVKVRSKEPAKARIKKRVKAPARKPVKKPARKAAVKRKPAPRRRPITKPVRKPARKAAPPKRVLGKPVKPHKAPPKKGKEKHGFKYLGRRTTAAGYEYRDYKAARLTPKKLRDFFKDIRATGRKALVHGTIQFKDKDGKTQHRSVKFVPTLDDYADDLIDDLESLADNYGIDAYTVVLSVTFARR